MGAPTESVPTELGVSGVVRASWLSLKSVAAPDYSA